jgi:hypothetical protein
MPRLICLAKGGCRWKVIREDWIPRTPERPWPQLVRFHECELCHDTKATLTSPDNTESMFSIPDRNNARVAS